MTIKDKRAEARDWLLENKCPWCVHGGRCRGYKARERLEGGWVCTGFRTKCYDERMWEK